MPTSRDPGKRCRYRGLAVAAATFARVCGSRPSKYCTRVASRSAVCPCRPIHCACHQSTTGHSRPPESTNFIDEQRGWHRVRASPGRSRRQHRGSSTTNRGPYASEWIVEQDETSGSHHPGRYILMVDVPGPASQVDEVERAVTGEVKSVPLKDCDPRIGRERSPTALARGAFTSTVRMRERSPIASA
jgi:hypothetical protein